MVAYCADYKGKAETERSGETCEVVREDTNARANIAEKTLVVGSIPRLKIDEVSLDFYEP